MTQATNKTITINLNTTKQLQGSGMMTQATAQKGRLEQLLDDFTDVHGTVLLGMHKELQTLRKDVDARVEARLVEFLAQVSAAESGVRKQMEGSQELCTRLQELTARGEVIAQGLADFADGSSKAMREARDSALADIRILTNTFVQERAAFLEKASEAQQRMLNANEDARKRMAAAVAVSNAMNHESQALMQQVLERQTLLHQRDLQMQKRTRQLAIGVGLVVSTTLGFWTWLTLTH